MSLARARSRGARLNARFGVNGSQNESRSFGWRAGAALTFCVIRFIAASAEEIFVRRSFPPFCQKPAIASHLPFPFLSPASTPHPSKLASLAPEDEDNRASFTVLATRFSAPELCQATARKRLPPKKKGE